MNMQNLLIADSSEDFRQALAQHLQGQYAVACCSSGTQALELLRTRQWDILVMDLLLPELDGISLLHQLLQEGIRPRILVATRFTNPYVQEQCLPLGIGYLLRKPCSPQAVADRLLELSGWDIQPWRDPRAQAAELLLSLRLSTKHDGFAYLKESFPVLSNAPHLSMTKELYPTIGAMFGRDGALVERSIRSAIESAWSKREPGVWERYFPGCTRRPTNAQFISRMMEELQDEGRCQYLRVI